MKSSSDVNASWNKFLNPELLKQNLLQGGLFLAAFEMLKESLVRKPRNFLCFTGFTDGQATYDYNSPDYITQIRSLHKHPYTASALWWKNQGALSDEDLELLKQIREHRDNIAHEMPKMISSSNHDIDLELLKRSSNLVAKLDNWWLQNIEAQIDLERFAHFSQADLDEATSLNSIFLSMMIPLATGDDTLFQELYSVWSAHQKHHTAPNVTH